jgi:hypothetical protein
MGMNTITVTAVIDIAAALSNESLSGNVYFIDNNKVNGSSGEGTETLRTMVKKGDRLVWSVHALECEAFSGIEEIIIDKNTCEPEKKIHEHSDFTYWVGTVKQDVKVLAYNVRFRLGSRAEAMTTVASPCLVGEKA